jgi:hypothetical protein
LAARTPACRPAPPLNYLAASLVVALPPPGRQEHAVQVGGRGELFRIEGGTGAGWMMAGLVAAHERRLTGGARVTARTGGWVGMWLLLCSDSSCQLASVPSVQVRLYKPVQRPACFFPFLLARCMPSTLFFFLRVCHRRCFPLPSLDSLNR